MTTVTRPTRMIYDVEYVDDPESTTRQYRVRVVMADRIAAEARGRQYGLLDPPKQPQLTGALWLWFASIREGHIPNTTTFAEFQERCIDNVTVGDPEPVPPTSESGEPSSLSLSASPGSDYKSSWTTTD